MYRETKVLLYRTSYANCTDFINAVYECAVRRDVGGKHLCWQSNRHTGTLIVMWRAYNKTDTCFVWGGPTHIRYTYSHTLSIC